MPLKIDKLIATEVFVDGNEVTGKEGSLTNIWIPLQLNGDQSGGVINLYGIENNLFYGDGSVLNSGNLSNQPFSFYEDNNGLIHIGVRTDVGGPA
jgi:hypothetical protein